MKDKDRWQTYMIRAQEGDASAYALVLKELCLYLRNYLRPRMPDDELVEDLVQEILMALHTARHTWRPNDPFMPWLHGIVRYKLADVLRISYKRHAYEVVDTNLLVTLSMPAPNKDIDGAYIDMDTILATLTPRQRDIICMTKLEGHTAEETGHRLGMSAGAVKVTLHRILQSLKQQFGSPS